jgi:hypothetical protein
MCNTFRGATDGIGDLHEIILADKIHRPGREGLGDDPCSLLTTLYYRSISRLSKLGRPPVCR